jgi:hypothetical protein
MRRRWRCSTLFTLLTRRSESAMPTRHASTRKKLVFSSGFSWRNTIVDATMITAPKASSVIVSSVGWVNASMRLMRSCSPISLDMIRP